MNSFETPEPEDLRVLDYLKQKLSFGTVLKPVGTEPNGMLGNVMENEKTEQTNSNFEHNKIGPTPQMNNLLFWGGLFLIALAQLIFLLKPMHFMLLGGVLMALGAAGIFLSLQAPFLPSQTIIHLEKQDHHVPKNPWLTLLTSLTLGLLSYVLFRNNGLGWVQLLVWLVAIATYVLGFWDWRKRSMRDENETSEIPKTNPIIEKIKGDRSYYLVCVGVILFLITSHLYWIFNLPVDLVSSQVETFISVEDIRNGSQALLFPNNVVSEPLNYYWLALVSLFFGNGARLLAFNVAYMIAFAIGLVFLFKLGRLLFNRWVGLVSVLMFGSAFWPVLQNYAMLGYGLVFPILSASLFYLYQGFEQGRQQDFIIFGLLSGLGLLTNKLFLIMPIVFLMALLVWILDKRNWKKGRRYLAWLGLALFAVFLMVIPLIAALSHNTEVYIQPIMSRISGLEIRLEGHPLLIFIKNYVSAFCMLNDTNRSGWVDGIPNRPALDGMSAVLFIIGLVGVIRQFMLEKSWKMISTVLLLPVFLIPSAMSIAFPLENPSLSRAFGLAVPAFIIGAYGLALLFEKLRNVSIKSKFVLIGIIVLIVMVSNAYLIGKVYQGQYQQNAWNAKEMSETIKNFQTTYGKDAKAWVAGHPYWVDERAVAIQADMPIESLKLNLDDQNDWKLTSGARMFILNVEAFDALARLRTQFPNGVESLVQSQQEGKNFITFFVPEK